MRSEAHANALAKVAADQVERLVLVPLRVSRPVLVELVAVIGGAEGAGLGIGATVQREGIEVDLGAEQLVDANLDAVSLTGHPHIYERILDGGWGRSAGAS